MKTFIRGWIMWILFVMLMAFPFASTMAQSDQLCTIYNAVNDSTGEKRIITDCPADIGSETPIPTATRTPTKIPTIVAGPTLTPVVTPMPPGEPSAGIWISKAEVEALPLSGAWSAVQSAASGSCTPDLANQDSPCNVTVQAQALVWAKTGDEAYRQKVVTAIRSIVTNQSESGGRTLALGRELGAYVVAADLIQLPSYDPQLHAAFSARLREMLSETLDGMTLPQMHARRPNNWGTMGGGSIAAVCAYLQDKACLDRTAQIFRGWLGNRSAYSSFSYGALDWQCNPSTPAGVNPTGCQKNGFDIGGALPDDMRRGGGFKMPNPSPTGYACGAMSGATAQAYILHRAGYPTFEWEDRGMLRARQFIERIGWECSGDDDWVDALLNHVYGTNFSVNDNGPGKNMGWTQATHTGAVAAQDVIVVSDTRKIVTGETLETLQDEINDVMALEPGWATVGEPYTITTPDDGELFAQDMERQ